MYVPLPKDALALIAAFEQAGFEIFVVGGAVRDILLGKAPESISDWDFTTNALPEEMLNLFPTAFYENEFGTVGITRQHLAEVLGLPVADLSPNQQAEVYEVTTYRSEAGYLDHRRPESVQWGSSLEEDLQRRDFTINALAIGGGTNPLEEKTKQLNPLSYAQLPPYPKTNVRVIDPYGGQADLRQGIVRAVGNPQERFTEDALRMMRAIRIAAQLEFRLDPETLIALTQQAELITHISWERIRDEFLKTLVTPHPDDALQVFATTGLLQHILPELLETKGIEQRGHHQYDVWTHSLKACATCPSSDPVVRFATLLHDIAKPETQAPLPHLPGEYSFFNHEVIGARKAKEIAKRFRLSKEDVQRVFTLVRWHMFHYKPEMTDSAIRRFMRRVGIENLTDILALRTGDRLGSGSSPTNWRLEEMKERIEQQMHQPMKVSDIAVSGTDVMEQLNIPPGPKVGEVLNALFEEVLDDPEKNTREFLLERMKSVV